MGLSSWRPLKSSLRDQSSAPCLWHVASLTFIYCFMSPNHRTTLTVCSFLATRRSGSHSSNGQWPRTPHPSPSKPSGENPWLNCFVWSVLAHVWGTHDNSLNRALSSALLERALPLSQWRIFQDRSMPSGTSAIAFARGRRGRTFLSSCTTSPKSRRGAEVGCVAAEVFFLGF